MTKRKSKIEFRKKLNSDKNIVKNKLGISVKENVPNSAMFT